METITIIFSPVTQTAALETNFKISQPLYSMSQKFAQFR